MKGWHKESHRHYLAAKGIKTSRYTAKKANNWRLQYLEEPETIKGGLAKGRHSSEFDKEQIKKGIKIEMEHTTNPKIAREIAKDHLAEDPKYYDHLEEMEEKYDSSRKGMTGYMASKIVVPPAWKNVKYPKDKPYVATGVDIKGRTQYIYPEAFTKKTKAVKFKRIEKLEKAIPAVMSTVVKDIDKGNNPEAEVVYTMYKTGFRPGTDKDTLAEKKAYGASNLLKKQVKVSGDNVHFKFTGKKGVEVDKTVKDKRLANIVKKRKAGTRLFDTSETQVRDYFKQKTKGRFKLKDLRTLKASTVAKHTKGDKKEIARVVSEDLGNTPAVAIGSYIPPKVIA